MTLNDESYFVKSVAEPPLRAEGGVIDEPVSTVKPFFEHGPMAATAVFGGVARGEAGPKSDIGFLIVSDDREGAIDRSSEANDVAVSKFGNGLSLLVIDAGTFKRGRGVVNSVLESYVQVSGRDLKELAGGQDADR